MKKPGPLLEFEEDHRESYFRDMREVSEKQHAPILTGLRALAVDREWEVEVVPLVVGQQEQLFGSYWRHTFGPSSSLSQLLGKGISVRASQPPQGG